ncbi:MULTISPECIES: YcaO-like family protein [unclassified Sinorhizobium]|uniref:YcaO-like family protein n=1 Tax=unclassified Sinorhizobium TaxID=2613772 RepID=UPI003525A6BF
MRLEAAFEQTLPEPVQRLADAIARREHSFSSYHDRKIPPAETLEAITPFFGDLGITRIGTLTGLDTLGIPVAFATRPNSYSLSVFQGKGVDQDAAMASAAMEALETRIAEIAPASPIWATVDEVRSSNTPMIDLASTARCVPSMISTGPIPWVSGLDVVSGNSVLVPWWLAGMDHRGESPAGFELSSDGLASGNTAAEAFLHGLCELVERDAWTLLQLKADHELEAHLVDPAGIDDAVVAIMLGRIKAAKMQLALLDMTTDIRIPAFLALLVPSTAARRSDVRWSEICGGCGCHPDPVRAVLRAITEAAQSRLTAIAGSRDDFLPRIYQQVGRDHALMRLTKLSLHRAGTFSPGDASLESASINETIGHVLTRLRNVGVTQAIAVPMQDQGLPVSVLRVLVPGLEVELTGSNIQLGVRAVEALGRLRQ